MKTVLLLFALGFVFAPALPAQAHSWRQGEHALALLNGTNVIWQIVADPAQGKPYFHPLATPGGARLTDLRPPDHPWHRGLWFSWKYINGLNYWEEDRQTGRSEAVTELVESKLQSHKNGSADLRFSINYHPWNAAPVLTEQRRIQISAPAHGRYELRWVSEFTAVTNVTLARTPLADEPHGQSWGGYAGLSLRLNAAARSWIFSNSQNSTGEKDSHGQPAAWMKLSAGTNRAAVTIFDDVQNARHPSPWYVSQAMLFFSPALLFRQPLEMAAGEKLTLRYRFLITDHDLTETNSLPQQEPK